MREFAREGSPDLRIPLTEFRHLGFGKPDNNGIFVRYHAGCATLYREDGCHLANVVGCDTAGEGLAIYHDVERSGNDQEDLGVIAALVNDGGPLRNVEDLANRGDALGEAPVTRYNLLLFERFDECAFIVKMILHARPSPKI